MRESSLSDDEDEDRPRPAVNAPIPHTAYFSAKQAGRTSRRMGSQTTFVRLPTPLPSIGQSSAPAPEPDTIEEDEPILVPVANPSVRVEDEEDFDDGEVEADYIRAMEDMSITDKPSRERTAGVSNLETLALSVT